MQILLWIKIILKKLGHQLKKLVNDKIEKEDIENTIFELKKIVQESNENF